MNYEIVNAHVARRQRLSDRDNSRSYGMRLVVQRCGRGKAIVSLVVTDIGGHRLAETRLGAATIDTTSSTGSPLSPGEIMRRALAAIGL